MIGDWKPPKVGERKRGNSYYLGQLRLRLKINEAEKKCKELGISTKGIEEAIAASQVKRQNPTQSRYNELMVLLKEKEEQSGTKKGWFS